MIDCFGVEILRVTGIVFTKANGALTLAEAKEQTEGIKTLICQRSGINPSTFNLPCWQIDCFPE